MESIRVEEISTEWGSMPRYCFVDYDFETNEVYFYDVTDWKLYGMKYEMDGDSVKVDFDSKQRKKYAIVDFDEGDMDPVGAVFNEMFCMVSERYADTNSKLNVANDTTDQLKADVAKLQEFKTNAEAELTNYRLKSIREKFADLTGVEEFESLCDKMNEYSFADFEEKCFAIRGKNTGNVKFSLEPAATKLPVMGHQGGDFVSEPYNGLFIKFGKNAN